MCLGDCISALMTALAVVMQASAKAGLIATTTEEGFTSKSQLEEVSVWLTADVAPFSLNIIKPSSYLSLLDHVFELCVEVVELVGTYSYCGERYVVSFHCAPAKPG